MFEYVVFLNDVLNVFGLYNCLFVSLGLFLECEVCICFDKWFCKIVDSVFLRIGFVYFYFCGCI